jgi:hypothetical protein
MLIVPALEYEKIRQEAESWNKIILHREGKFYRCYEWSLWLIKTIVCTEDFQKQRGDDKVLSAKRYVGKKTGEYTMTGFPVDSLSKFIPEYIAIRPMEGDDDLEIEIDMHLTGNETYEQLNQEFTDWKRGLEVYVAEDKKSSKGATVQKARGGAFQIVSQLLAYPVEKKTSSENVEFISSLKELAAELL